MGVTDRIERTWACDKCDAQRIQLHQKAGSMYFVDKKPPKGWQQVFINDVDSPADKTEIILCPKHKVTFETIVEKDPAE